MADPLVTDTPVDHVEEADVDRREPEYTTNFPGYPSANQHPGNLPLTEQGSRHGVRVEKDLRTFIALQVNPPDTVSPVRLVNAQIPHPVNGTRRSITVFNSIGGTIFLDGNQQVSASIGFPLAVGGVFVFDKEPWGELWMIASVVPADIRVMIEYGYGGSFTELA